jgi:hypothetical protein
MVFGGAPPEPHPDPVDRGTVPFDDQLVGRPKHVCLRDPGRAADEWRGRVIGLDVFVGPEKVDDQTYLYRLTHSKTDQAGTEHNPDADKPITGMAAEALTHWLHASGITTGPIFRRVRKTKAAEPLSGQAVGLIVKRRAQLAGLEGISARTPSGRGS